MDDIKTLVGQYPFLKNEDKILKADTQNDDVIKKKQEEIEAKQAEIKEKEAEIEPKIKLIDSKIEQTENDQEKNETKKTNQEDFTKEHRKRMLNNQDTSGITKTTDKMTKYEKYLSNIRNNPTFQSKQHGWNEEKLQGLQDESKQLSNTLDGLRKQKETLQGELQKLQQELQTLQQELENLQSKQVNSTEILNTYKMGIEYIKKIVDTFKINTNDFKDSGLNITKKIKDIGKNVLKNKTNVRAIFDALGSITNDYHDITIGELVNLNVNTIVKTIQKQLSFYDFIINNINGKEEGIDELKFFFTKISNKLEVSRTRYSRSSYAKYAMYTQYTF